jgi:hypothetical protein
VIRLAPRDLRRVLGRHRPFVVLFGLGLLLRIVTMVAYRPAIFYIDSFASYVLPLSHLDPTGQDPLGYDLLLLGPVLNLSNFPVVVAVQHLIGLAMAVALYRLLRHKGAGRWLAALATAPGLLDAYQIQIEHNIMSDPLFEALIVGALTVLVWPARPSWKHVAVAGLLIGCATTVRQVGEFLFIPVIVYAVIRGGPGWRRLSVTGAALVAFLGPVGAYATWFHTATGRFGITNVGGNALYGRVATFADCDGLTLPAAERVLCPTTPVAQRGGTDFWAHDPGSPYFKLRDSDPAHADQLAADFAHRVIRHQPWAFTRAVLGDAAKVLAWNREDATVNDPTVERWRFQTQFPTFPDLVTVDSVNGLADRWGGGHATVVRPLALFLRGYQLSVGYTPGPGLVLAAVLALLAFRRRGGAPALLFLGTTVLLLLVGDVVVFSWRYQLPAYILLPVAAVLGLTTLRRREPVPFPEPVDQAALDALDPGLVFPPVVVLIAAYNEGTGIGPVLDAVPDTVLGEPVASLVVVDGASDNTASVARAHGAVVCDLPVNRGQGAALRLGYHVAERHGAKFIVTTDADGQYKMDELPRLLEPLLAGEADFVTGSRQLGANESTDAVRRVGTRVFARLVTVLTGHTITDTSFGFRAMRAEVPTSVRLDQPQYQASELLVAVLSHGYTVLERPMTMHRRNQGKSKKGNNLVYGLRYTRVVLGTWWRERNTRRSSKRNLAMNNTA